MPMPGLPVTFAAALLTMALPAAIGWLTAEPLLRRSQNGTHPEMLWQLLSAAAMVWLYGILVTWIAVPFGAAACRSLARRGWDGLPVALLVGAGIATALFLAVIAGPNLWFGGIGHLLRMLPLLALFLFAALTHAALYWALLRALDRRARKSC